MSITLEELLESQRLEDISGYHSLSISNLPTSLCETVFIIVAIVLHCARSAADRAECI